MRLTCMSCKYSTCFSSCLYLQDICRQRSNINVFIFLLFSHLICIYLPAFLSLTNFFYFFFTLQRSGSGLTLQRSGSFFICFYLLIFQYSVNRSGLSRVIFAYPQRRPWMSQRCERSYIGFFVLAFLSIFREQIWFIEGHFCVPAEKTLDEPEM